MSRKYALPHTFCSFFILSFCYLQRLSAVVIMKLNFFPHITEEYIFRMLFQNFFAPCIPLKTQQLRNICLMKDHRIACSVSLRQTPYLLSAFQKSIQKTVHRICPQMGLVRHKKSVKILIFFIRAAHPPALPDPKFE